MISEPSFWIGGLIGWSACAALCALWLTYSRPGKEDYEKDEYYNQ